MSSKHSSPAAWFIALLAVAPLGGVLSVALTGAASDASAAPDAPVITEQDTPPATPLQEQPEVLSRGPVHEAFAEPVNTQLETGLIAPSQPPPNIEEVPPADRPQGRQFVWIPGYWSWDADRNSYIWVSACWREAPPNKSWVPGYWSRVSEGWEWVAGFWTPTGVREIEYLPAPPAITEVEPPAPATSPDTIWVPPCMYWSQSRYVRREGYWLAAQPNWVWVPSHYISTPRGYIFAEGHWDYPLERRGMLFAPVCFPAALSMRAGFTYSPSVVIDVGLLRVSLFAYPRYSHYFFGDYYDDAYLRIGIFPWFDSRRNHAWYDPIYEHDRWQNLRAQPRWEEREREDYNRRRANTELRPARTYREQESRLAKMPEPQRRAFQVTQPMNAAASRGSPMKFERIGTDARQRISKQATAVSAFRDERNRWESAPASPRANQPSVERRSAVIPPAERQPTVQSPRENKAAVQPPAERQPTVQVPKEHKAAVTPPAERQPTVQSPRENKAAVQPPAERQPTIQSPREQKTAVQPPAERQPTIQSPREQKAAVQPRTERQPTVQAPRENKAAVTPPAAVREPAQAPSREAKAPQPERVQVPASPIAGRSGGLGIFQKGPPSRPSDEGKANDGSDLRFNGESAHRR